MKPSSLPPAILASAFLAFATPSRAQDPAPHSPPLRPGDALLVRIDNVGGGIPEYREIVDSDGRIELPFLGMADAAGKTIPALESEMAAAYARADLSTNPAAHVRFVLHFDSPPARSNLFRSRDPRRPVPAQQPLAP